jgi:hypothetical protein
MHVTDVVSKTILKLSTFNSRGYELNEFDDSVRIFVKKQASRKPILNGIY